MSTAAHDRSQDETAYLALKGMISELPAEMREPIEAAAQKIREIISTLPGFTAMGIVGMELQLGKIPIPNE